jgi:hypothetical protein
MISASPFLVCGVGDGAGVSRGPQPAFLQCPDAGRSLYLEKLNECGLLLNGGSDPRAEILGKVNAQQLCHGALSANIERKYPCFAASRHLGFTIVPPTCTASWTTDTLHLSLSNCNSEVIDLHSTGLGDKSLRNLVF